MKRGSGGENLGSGGGELGILACLGRVPDPDGWESPCLSSGILAPLWSLRM